MKYVTIDTETTNLFDYRKPADAEGQPRLAQLALVFLAPDHTIEREVAFLIKPEGWTMSAETAAIHGLTQEKLLAEGVPVLGALTAYNEALDGEYIVVGYNVSYDLKVMRGELRRAGLADRFETTRSVDCMRPLTSVCKIPKAKGNGYKLPKLVEAYRHLFNKDFDGAHGAPADAHACAEIFRHMVANNLLSEAHLSGLKEVKGSPT